MKCAVSSQLSDYLADQDSEESMIEDIEENLLPDYIFKLKRDGVIKIWPNSYELWEYEENPQSLVDFIVKNYHEIYSEY